MSNCSLQLDTLRTKSLGAIPLATCKMAKTEAPKRLWILGESYENAGNTGMIKTHPYLLVYLKHSADENPCHIAYWERKDKDKDGEWFAQNKNRLTGNLTPVCS